MRKICHTLQDNLSMLKILISYNIYGMEYEIKICCVFTTEIKPNCSKYCYHFIYKYFYIILSLT